MQSKAPPRCFSERRPGPPCLQAEEAEWGHLAGRVTHAGFISRAKCIQTVCAQDALSYEINTEGLVADGSVLIPAFLCQFVYPT